jgi:hypothetical protein
VSGAGSVVDPTGISISSAAGSQSGPAVAWNGTDFLVVWNDIRSGTEYDIYGAGVGGDGTVAQPDGILISISANGQTAPAVAWNGTHFLVVWVDARPGNRGIYGARVDGAGTVLDPAGILITTEQFFQTSPAVAWNGTNFLVVWAGFGGGESDIYGARVDGAGTVLDPAGIAISTAANYQTKPKVTWGLTNFLVVWEDDRTYPDNIYGARVTGAGSVLDPAGIPISTATGQQLLPAVSFGRNKFLVVWEDRRSGTEDIYGTRVTTGGAVLDPAGISVSTASDIQSEPAVASVNFDFFVVWQDRRSGTSYDIYGAGVGGDGTVAQPAGIPISTGTKDETVPELDVRYDFLVAWRDLRFGTAYAIFARRISPNGVLKDSGSFGVTGAGTKLGVLAVTGGPGATWGIAYERFAAEASYGAHRVFLRSVSPK